MKQLTKLSELNKKKIKKIVNLTVMWSINKWGLNRRRKKLLTVDFIWLNSDDMAVYHSSENRIVIYPNMIRNIRDLIDTVIHEYTHQMQSLSNYNLILSKTGYSKHPMEIEANENALSNRAKCWKEIKKYL